MKHLAIILLIIYLITGSQEQTINEGPVNLSVDTQNKVVSIDLPAMIEYRDTGNEYNYADAKQEHFWPNQ